MASLIPSKSDAALHFVFACTGLVNFCEDETLGFI